MGRGDRTGRHDTPTLRPAATRDLGPIIARVFIENPPRTRDPEATIVWALRTWPSATYEEAHRAMQIAQELAILDLLAPDA